MICKYFFAIIATDHLCIAKIGSLTVIVVLWRLSYVLLNFLKILHKPTRNSLDVFRILYRSIIFLQQKATFVNHGGTGIIFTQCLVLEILGLWDYLLQYGCSILNLVYFLRGFRLWFIEVRALILQILNLLQTF